MDSRSAAINLELTLAGDALSGLASDEAGHQREFSGWLGLVSAIEELIAPTPEGGPQQ